jgi:hypothetical protein
VSCPDWKTLAAWRDDPRAEEPAEWQEALAHLDRGCVQCRRAAIAADPTLVFRRLAVVPAVPTSSPAQEASDVEAMRRAVAAMRAASRVEASERRGRPARAARALKALSWKRWGVAAALALAALSLPAGPGGRYSSDQSSDQAAQPHRQPVAVALPATPAKMMTAVSLETGVALLGDDLPTLEGVDRPGARVYHMDGEGLTGTMIFDESLDV